MLLTREELQERLFALHRASLELIKDISLETLLERIASLACEQSGAHYAALGVLDNEGKLKQFITVGMTSEEIKRIPHSPRGLGLIGALMDSHENIRMPEISADPRSVGFPSGHAPMHSFLGVPIRLGERQLGQIYLTEKLDAPEFTADDETIIEMLAAYAGVAIENARLVQGIQVREQALKLTNKELALMNKVGVALAASLELEEVLNKTLALLMEHFKVEAGEFFLREDDNETYRLVLHRGEAAEAFWARSRFKIGEGMVGEAAKLNKPVVSHHLDKDERLLRSEVVKAGFKQLACIPLTAHGEIVGVLTIATRSRKPLSQGELQTLTSIGMGAGTAIENARLHANVRRLAVLEERERIGMDLHDGVIQSIYGVGLTLENARLSMAENPKNAEEHIQRAIDDLNHTIRDIRSYILDLRPRQLHGEGLVEGVQRLIAEFRQNAKLEVVMGGLKADHFTDLPQSHSMALFHICQEALANIAKHANAKKVAIELWGTSERVLLEIQDDGAGFETAKADKAIGHGLANMQTRVANVGGDVDIVSAPGEGTTILAWVPRKE
jgi:signal transduction histidine kinase